MSNILFFSRCELTYLYGSIDKYLKDNYNTIHIAYDDYEKNILRDSFGIENIIHFKNEMKKVTQEDLSKINLQEIDDFLLRTTSGNFNLNGALSANRTGIYLTYEQNIILLKTYYLVWKNIFLKYKIDFFFHEPVSLLMVQIAACFCKEMNAVFSTNQSLSGIDNDTFYFTMIDDYLGEPTYLLKQYNKITITDINENITEIKAFISKTRKNLNILVAALGTGNISMKDYYLLKVKSFLLNIRRIFISAPLDPIVDNIELFLQEQGHQNMLEIYWSHYLIKMKKKNLNQLQLQIF